MREIPCAWESPSIGTLCNLINGRAFKPSDWTVSGLPIVRIQNLKDEHAPLNRFNGEVREQFLIDSGQLLFAWSGTPGTSFGAHIWNGGPAVLNQHIFKIEFDEPLIDKAYFKHAINQKVTELISRAHGGVGLAHVTKGVFESTEIPLPPFAEQRRIVAKLDALTARTARARADLDRIPALAARYKQVVLDVAFSGVMSADWRAQHNRDQTRWTSRSVKDLATVVTGMTPAASDRQTSFGGQTPFFKPTELDQGYNVVVARETLTEHGVRQSRSVPAKSTLVTCIGATIGKTGFSRVACCMNQQINAMTSRGDVLPEWLYWVAVSPDFQQQILDNASATTLPIINKSRFEHLTMPHCPLDEQEEIVRRIETAFAEIDRLATEAAAARRLLDRLDQAILAKAFRGELVSQDPADEAASVLLARIKAARAGAPTRAHRGRKAKAA